MSRIVTAVTWRRVEIRRPRRRSTETVLLRLDVPAELPSAGTGEIGIAATVQDPKGGHRRFHAHAGRFVQPTDGAVDEHRVSDYFAGGYEGRFPPPFCVVPGREAPFGGRALSLPSEIAGEVVEIVSDDAEARMADVRRQVGEHVLAGGMLWRPAFEPFWSVTRSMPGDVVSLRLAARAPGEAAPPGEKDCGPGEEIASFRLDRAACADRFARAAAHRRRRRYDDPAPVVLLGNIALSRDDRLEAALALGRRTVELLPAGWLRLLPGSAIVDWCRLRDDIADGARDADALARRALGLIAAVDALELNVPGEEDRRKLRQRLGDALARFCEHEDPLPPLLLEASEDLALASLGGSP